MSSVSLPSRSLLLSLLLLRSGPQARKPWLHKLLRFAVGGLYLYAAVLLALMALEDRLLFSPKTAADYWNPPPDDLDPQEVDLTSPDGTRLHAWWCAPPYWRPEQGALLYCHGNGCNLSTPAQAATVWRDQLHVAVLLFDYPGFGHSEGRPSEAGCCAAADAAYDWLVQKQKVPAQRLLIYGLSLGGGVAVDLASRRPHRALLLTSTFTSFPDLAQTIVPFTPAKWLAHNQFRSLDKIAHIATPVFIAHGSADLLIPYRQGECLYEAATSEHKRFLRIEDGPHDLVVEWKIPFAVRDFLLEVEDAS
jgi:uncharacterized protein